MADCEYLLKFRRKPDLVFQVKCSLTGHTCLLEGLDRSQCTRRKFALAYEAKHNATTRLLSE